MKIFETERFEKLRECPPGGKATTELVVPGKLTDTFEFCVPIGAALL